MMTLTGVQELLNSLGAHFIIYTNNKDPKARHLMLKVLHPKDDNVTLMIFDMDGLNGVMVPAGQEVSRVPICSDDTSSFIPGN